jgi:flagellar export protein FliJ
MNIVGQRPIRGKSPLQALLTLRQRQEDVALHAYAQALGVVTQAEEVLRSVENELNNAQAYFQEKLLERCTASELLQVRVYTDGVEQQRKKSANRVHTVRQSAQEELRRWFAARQAREQLETYLEKQAQRFARYQRRKQEKVVDDLAASRFFLTAYQNEISSRRAMRVGEDQQS